jgi:hypothetical protein
MRLHAGGAPAARSVGVRDLVIAGWTARDREALERHIAELAALGVARPESVPCFWPVAPGLVTTASEVRVRGPGTSGEAEFVIWALEDGLWVGAGSDHTDRKREAESVPASKAACAKPVAPDLWPFAEVEEHWDELVLRSWSGEGRARRLYQEGKVSAVRPPRDLIRRYLGRDADLPAGTVLFCGTIPALCPIAGADRFEFELEDPVRRRAIRHAYSVRGA